MSDRRIPLGDPEREAGADPAATAEPLRTRDRISGLPEVKLIYSQIYSNEKPWGTSRGSKGKTLKSVKLHLKKPRLLSEGVQGII